MKHLNTTLALLFVSIFFSTTFAQNCDANYSYMDTINNQIAFSPDSYDSNLNYFWDFGDGNTSTNAYPFHEYSNGGLFNVCLTVSDNNTPQCSDTVCQTVFVDTNQCTTSANFSYNDQGNGTYDFQALNTGSTLYYQWTIGNSYYNGPSATHTFPSNGQFNATLYVVDSLNQSCEDTVTYQINVTGVNNCNVSASYSYQDTVNGQVAFEPDVYDNNLNYFWDFGDGNTANNAYPYHQYTNPGTYTACLTVWETGNTSCVDTVCQTIYVPQDSTCNADFYLFEDSVNTNIYYIWNLSSGSNLSYSWDFGDGTTSNQQYPTHTYSSQGTYTICLSITDNQNNCTDQYCETIQVLNKATGTTINVVPFGQTSGVESEKEITVDATVYPNPATSKVNIVVEGNSAQAYNYEIMNVMGTIIDRGQLNGKGNKQSKSVELYNMETGVYFIQLIDKSNKEHVETIKLIKR